MRETADDIAWLQTVLDDSNASAGPHLQSIFGGANRLSAEELASSLGGVFEMHLATLSGSGAPLVAPIDGIFMRGKVFFSVPGAAVRSRLLTRDQRVSASYAAGSFAFIVHGTAIGIAPDSVVGREFNDVAREAYNALYGDRFWDGVEERRLTQPDDGFTGWIDPRVMFAKR